LLYLVFIIYWVVRCIEAFPLEKIKKKRSCFCVIISHRRSIGTNESYCALWWYINRVESAYLNEKKKLYLFTSMSSRSLIGIGTLATCACSCRLAKTENATYCRLVLFLTLFIFSRRQWVYVEKLLIIVTRYILF